MLSVLFLLLSGFLLDNDDNLQSPPTYHCKRVVEVGADFTSSQFWEHAEWIPYFVDLKTGEKADFSTQAKMLWDDSCLYVMVEMVDTHLWAEQAENEGKIYLDKALELFVDPDGDGLNYIEYEINALGTTWDLLMAKPYRDGGSAISNYDMKGVKKKIELIGTINNSTDIDTGWTLYLAIPFENFTGLCPKPAPKKGDTWRLNLARVHWALDVENGVYEKSKNPKTGRNISKYWVWSSHGAINMHMPERFGCVVFD